MTELTHEQLALLLECYGGRVSIRWDEELCWLWDSGLTQWGDGLSDDRLYLTPAGRELVDIALRAVNAHRRARG